MKGFGDRKIDGFHMNGFLNMCWRCIEFVKMKYIVVLEIIVTEKVVV